MWEKISEPAGVVGLNVFSCRLRVPGGWIIRTVASEHESGVHVSMVFVTDPTHMWELQ
jgi:hypothetical protein